MKSTLFAIAVASTSAAPGGYPRPEGVLNLDPMMYKSISDMKDFTHVLNPSTGYRTAFYDKKNSLWRQGTEFVQSAEEINPVSPTGLEPAPVDRYYDQVSQMRKPLIPENRGETNDLMHLQLSAEEYPQPDIRGPMPKNAHPDSTFSSHLHNDWTV